MLFNGYASNGVGRFTLRAVQKVRKKGGGLEEKITIWTENGLFSVKRGTPDYLNSVDHIFWKFIYFLSIVL